MHKKFFVWYGLVWLAMVIISILDYREIFYGHCYFQSSNLFCNPTLSVSQKFFVFCLWTIVFTTFIFFGRYLWRSYITDEMPPHKILLLVFSFFAATVLVVPFGSSDTNYYFAVGRSISNGLNPYVDKWSMEKDFAYPVPRDVITGFSYGPIIATSFAVIYKLVRGNLIWFIAVWKFFMLISLIVCADLTYYLARAVAGPVHRRNFFIAFALQPIFLFEWVTNGHFDVLWLITVIGALLAIHHKKWWLAIPLLVAGVWIKFLPILISPILVLWWWQSLNKENAKRQLLQTAVGVLLGAAITIISWYPYWRGLIVFQSVMIQSKWAVISLFAVLYYALKPLFTVLFHDAAHWYLTRAAQGFLLVFLAVFLWPYLKKMLLIIRRKLSWSTAEYITAIFVYLMLYLFIWQKSFLPWYGSWFLPFALILIAAARSERVYKIAAWLGTMPFVYYILWLGDWLLTRTDAGSELWFYICMVLIVAGYPLYSLWQWRKTGFMINEAATQPKIKYCFIVTSLIYCQDKKLSYSATRSIFSPEERYKQTLKTIESVRLKVPGAYIVCIEAGLEAKPFQLAEKVDRYIYIGDKKLVRLACDSFLKSLGEAVMLLAAAKNLPVAERYFKISGRYYLNDKFSISDWEKGDVVYYYIRPDFISTRLYSFSKLAKNILIGTLWLRLPYFFRDNAIENILARFTPSKYVGRTEKVGISGMDATNGKLITE